MEYEAPPKIDVLAASKNINFGEVYPAWTFNAYSSSVHHGCFSRVYHSTHSHEKTNSQGLGGPWYETEREALIALRIAKETEFTAALAKLDEKIAALSPVRETVET